MKLTIVIPALNEEEAIGSIIERCLAARGWIVSQSPIDEVEIIVVSDGSTDRTAEVAAGYPDVELIIFESNRGYGAAIKEGFARGIGDVVGFLDADGTCDPRFFADLCSSLVEEEAAIALGSRLGPDSCMPLVRRIGNRGYALILSALSNRPVTDTASGMRAIRRSALSRLYPLPDGLHFTPAMSARALMDERLKIVELPMRYEERIGESKLHVIRDGLRFLRTIFEMTLMWRPTKVFLGLAVMSLVVMTMAAMHPIEMWLREGRLAEDMIYRLLFCSLLGAAGVTLLAAGVLSDLVHRLADDEPRDRTFVSTFLEKTYTFTGLAIASVVALPLMGFLVGPGIWSRLSEGVVHVHWSRVVLGGLVAFAWGQMIVTVAMANLIRFHTARKSMVIPRYLPGRIERPASVRSAAVSLTHPEMESLEPVTSID